MQSTFNLSIAAVATAFACAAHSQEVIKIGHAGPLSGPIAYMGKDTENGARLAIEELNAKGVTIGAKAVRFELDSHDDAADPRQATSVANLLVDTGVKGVVGHLNSGTSIPASRIYANAGIPQISPAATNPKLTHQNLKTTFRVVVDDAAIGGALGRYAVNELKGKAIAVIDDRTAYGQGIAEEFKKTVVAAKGNLVGHEFTTDRATDFLAILTRLKAKKPDVIFFGGGDTVAGPMVRQMKSLGIDAKLIGGDGMCTPQLAVLAGDALGNEKVYCAEAGGIEGQQKAGIEAFRTRFKARFGSDFLVFAAYSYDAVNVMAAAMVKADSSDPARYLPELAKTSGYPGITGPISFDEFGDIKNGALTLKTFKDKKLVELAVIR